MSLRTARYLLSALLLLGFAATTASAQTFFNIAFQKASDTDDSVEERVSGFPPARDCAVPCQTAHYLCRMINCSSVDVDGNCLTPYPDGVTNGVFIDTPPVTLPIDCARGVTVTGSGTWDPATCDVGTNTVRVENIQIPPGGNVIVSFWCAVNCDEGAVTNNATFDYDQNGSGAPRNAKDPLAAFGAPGLTVRVGNPSAAGITKDAPSLPIQMNTRSGTPGTTVGWIIEATNSNCEAYTLSEIYDVAVDVGCLSVDCSTLRLYLDNVPTPLPPGTTCPGPGDRAFTLGEMVIQPHQVVRIEYDAQFTRAPGPSPCCNTAYFQLLNSGLLYSSDPAIDSTLNPEATCVDLNMVVGVIADAIKRAEDAAGNEITTVLPGDDIYWRFTVDNQGGSDLTFNLTDTFPPEVVLGPGAIVLPFPDGTCSIAGQVLTCTGVTAPASSQVEMLVKSTFDCTGLAGGAEICNEATITAPGLPMPLTTHCPSCVGNPPFNRTCVTLQAPTFEFASKDAVDDSGNGLVLPGETVHYTIDALNSGTAAATSVVISDVLPAGLSYVAGTLALDGTSLSDAADGDDGEVVAGVVTVRMASVGVLAFGVGKVTFDARLDTPNGPNVCNGATITYAEAAPCGLGPQIVPDACLPIESVVGPPQLSAIKNVTPSGTVDAGTVLHYSIGTCNGPSAGPATGVIVTDAIPAGTTYVAGSMLLTGGPLTDGADADAGTLVTGSPDSLSFALGGMAAGQCLTVEFDVLIDAGATGVITNVGQFAADTVSAVNTNSVITPISVITPPADLSATKTSTVVGGAPVLVGGTINYVVRVCNAAGAGPATDVTIADAIPLDAISLCGSAFVPGSIRVDGVLQTDAADGDLARFDAAPAPGGVVAVVPTLDPGQCVDLTFSVTVDAGCDDREAVVNGATAAAVGVPSVSTNSTSDAVSDGGGGFVPALMRKEGGPLVNRCTSMPTPCGCEVGNRLDPVADDCITAGSCSQIDPNTWLVPGDLQRRVPIVYYEVDGAGCTAAGDPQHLVVRKTLPNDITVQLVP